MSFLYGNRFDRRRFLYGAGGAMVALPMLEALLPRRAYGATAVAPKRLVIFTTTSGRVVGNGRNGAPAENELWTPRTGSNVMTASGPLPVGISPMLEALDPIRDDIVTINGVDNVVRHAYASDDDAHVVACRTAYTCRGRGAGGSGQQDVGGASIDYEVGLRLRPTPGAGMAAMTPSIIIPASVSTMNGGDGSNVHYGTDGTAPYALSHNPGVATSQLFAGFTPPNSTPPPTPPPKTLRDKLRDQRKSMLDHVLDSRTS